jgi:hypothetical protein
LGRSPITMRPLFLSFFLGRLPITMRQTFSGQVTHYNATNSPFFFYLGKSPITMRSSFHLGRSLITMRPLFLFSTWAGCPWKQTRVNVRGSVAPENRLVWVCVGKLPMKIDQG